MTKIEKACLMLRISSVSYAVLTLSLMLVLFFLGFSGSVEDKISMLALVASIILCLGIIILVEVVIVGLKAQRKWGWIGGMILFATYVLSLFLPLGIIGMRALLNKESREIYDVEKAVRSWSGTDSADPKVAMNETVIEKEKLKPKFDLVYVVTGLTIVFTIIAGFLIV